jgi:putative two-component system response regulator
MPRRRSDTVLIVEDDLATRDMYRHAMMIAGYRVITVGDGIDALNIMEHERPAAVILDLRLPRLGGLDVYREIRAQPSTQGIPVIIVTGSDARELEATALRHFLRKPIQPDRLIETVERAIQCAVV